MGMYMCMQTSTQKHWTCPPRAIITDSNTLSNMGAKNPTPVFCKNSLKRDISFSTNIVILKFYYKMEMNYMIVIAL